MARQLDDHSPMSQYGNATRGARFLDVSPPLKGKMAGILEEIRSGRFAEESTREQASAGPFFERVREMRDPQPIAQSEPQARAAFRIGDAR